MCTESRDGRASEGGECCGQGAADRTWKKLLDLAGGQAEKLCFSQQPPLSDWGQSLMRDSTCADVNYLSVYKQSKWPKQRWIEKESLVTRPRNNSWWKRELILLRICCLLGLLMLWGQHNVSHFTYVETAPQKLDSLYKYLKYSYAYVLLKTFINILQKCCNYLIQIGSYHGFSPYHCVTFCFLCSAPSLHWLLPKPPYQAH